MNSPLLARYQALIAEGRIEADPAQAALVARLERLAGELAELPAGAAGRRAWPPPWRQAVEPPRGLYIYGAVGRGKTLLMDLFFEAAPVEKKRRVHFHAFLADAHMRIHVWRQQSPARRGRRRRSDRPGRRRARARSLALVL